jgi:hypothetical protein
MIPVNELWKSNDQQTWQMALDNYWSLVKPKNLTAEQDLDNLNLDTVRAFNAQDWYDFLKDVYFLWKYTAPNRYASTTKLLREFVDHGNIDKLDNIRKRLLDLKLDDCFECLETARRIPGLGTAGASGLLAVMYPNKFGTVDQFVVKALRQVENLPESAAILKMNPESLSTSDGVKLIEIFQRKANENNQKMKTNSWTPRKIDKVLWTYGR